MSDERLKEIVDDITSGKLVKLTEEEAKQISWNYEFSIFKVRIIILINESK